MNEILLILIILMIFIFLKIIFKEYFLITYIIITLLAIPSDLGTTLRTIIQISDYGLLFYIFFKEFGFDFKKYPRLPKSILFVIVLLYLSMILSMIFSNYPTAGLKLVFRSTAFFILVYLFYGIISTKERVKIIFTSILISGLVLTSGIIIDFILYGRSLAYLIQPIRDTSYGLYGNKNISGAYPVIIFPQILILLFGSKGGKKLLIWLSIIVIILSVLLIASRATLAGVIIGSAIILYNLNRRVFRFFMTVIMIFILGYFLIPKDSSIDYALRINGGLSNHDNYWKLAISMIKQNPIFGIGAGAYPLEEFNYIPVLLSSYEGQSMISIHDNTQSDGSNNSHNMYLVAASDMGILGFSSIILLIALFLRTIYKTFQKYKVVDQGVIMNLIMIFTVGICLILRGLVEPNGIFFYGTISVDLPFWLFFMILISYSQNRFKYQLDS